MSGVGTSSGGTEASGAAIGLSSTRVTERSIVSCSLALAGLLWAGRSLPGRAAAGRCRPGELPVLRRAVAALHAAGALPPGSPVPGQLAGLCDRLGIPGPGITAPPAADLPEPWQSLLNSYHRREARAGPAPGILTVIELPELDGAQIANPRPAP